MCLCHVDVHTVVKHVERYITKGVATPIKFLFLKFFHALFMYILSRCCYEMCFYGIFSDRIFFIISWWYKKKIFSPMWLLLVHYHALPYSLCISVYTHKIVVVISCVVWNFLSIYISFFSTYVVNWLVGKNYQIVVVVVIQLGTKILIIFVLFDRFFMRFVFDWSVWSNLEMGVMYGKW